ncbi:hypothetical protein SMB34_00020 [Thalassospira permensis NBRC 106175]|uniref:Uncharacterized protein n=1 Tax=Thalassospira permensis NBRC 106175 TaxID=1353532 RepID=A0ABR4TUZ3_9PROT|nr:hypothetical protein SMB34_00020 [Thalassospira permensis NBRC 106175]
MVVLLIFPFDWWRHFALRSAVLRLSLRPLNRSGGPENER